MKGERCLPPKRKFKREDIVEAAFEIAKERGFSAITARSVAKRLGSSVAPVYLHFAAINDLIAAVVERVFSLPGELLTQEKGPHLFENIGKASLAFAREYPVLFRELIMRPNPYMASYDTVEEEMVKALANDEALGGLSAQERRRVLLKMRVFQVGLSVMLANDLLPSWLDDQAASALLTETGEELISAQKAKRGKVRK
jgi:AcrR family transcriptional regulator